jgi:hypothetical protein
MRTARSTLQVSGALFVLCLLVGLAVWGVFWSRYEKLSVYTLLGASLTMILRF